MTADEARTEQEYDPVVEANERLIHALSQLKEARQVQKIFMGLGKVLSLGASQEEWMELLAGAVQSLFPRYFVLVQLCDPKTLALTAVRHSGPLMEESAEKLHLTRSAMQKTRLSPELAENGHVAVSEQLSLLFEGSAHAIHVPLVAEGELYGVIQLEGNVDLPLSDDDALVLIALANQMGLALRNQRLFGETAYLKDYLESILEHANALIVVTDKNRQIQVFNQAMERLLGFTKEQTLGTDVFQWLPQEEQERFAAEISNCIADRPSPGGIEIHMRNRQGATVHALYLMSSLRGKDGDIESLIMVGQDLTQIHALEFQIIETEKLASLGKLAAGVVHELNNPLTSISVYAEYLLKKLEKGTIDASDREKVERIHQGAQRIQRLTRDLISYGRPSSGDMVPVQLNEVVTQALGFCEHVIGKHDVCVNEELAHQLPLIIGNRTQLLQMLVNLVTNACQAMDGGGELTIVTRSPDRSSIVLIIADTGCGIPAKDLKQIFEPFYSTKKDSGGTGLGLSIVSRIVEHHRGQIELRSTPGEGTTFEIRFQTQAHPS